MKRLLYIVTLAATLLCGCEKENGESGGSKEPELTLEEKVCGEWHAQISSAQTELYAGFTEGKFELYQKVGDGVHRLYRGSWEMNDDIISGKYNDGQAWACSYKVELSGETMKWTSADASATIMEFRKKEIPEQVKENCMVEVKSDNSISAIW